MPNLNSYYGLISSERWLSKIDLIYRLKSMVDCSKEENKALLKMLYSMDFYRVKKDKEGKLMYE
ncbi:MAG: hypothetical protein C4308_07060 [Chitinophagaceae bacterium]